MPCLLEVRVQNLQEITLLQVRTVLWNVELVFSSRKEVTTFLLHTDVKDKVMRRASDPLRRQCAEKDEVRFLFCSSQYLASAALSYLNVGLTRVFFSFTFPTLSCASCLEFAFESGESPGKDVFYLFIYLYIPRLS